MTVGESIQEKRKSLGMTQKELAEKVGVATITIQQYERNVREPKFEIVKRIAKALGVSQFELLRPVMERDEDFINTEWFAEMSDEDILETMIPPVSKVPPKSKEESSTKNKEENTTRQTIPEAELRKRYIDNLLQCLNGNGQRMLCEVAKGICMLDDYRINMPISEFLNYEKLLKGNLDVKLGAIPSENK